MAATFSSDTRGGVDDQVSLTIEGAGTTRIVESYEVKQSLLEQPCAFALRTGTSTIAADLIKIARPKARCELRVGGVLQQTGFIDGCEVDDGPGGATVTIHGRDALAELHDAYIRADKSFKDISYGELTRRVLLEAIARSFTVTSGNDANRRKLIGGATPATTASQDDIAAAVSKPKQKDLTAKAGGKWYDFLKKEHDRAGLFLIATADGEFALIAPKLNQTPVCRILQEKTTFPRVSAERTRYKNLTTTRFSEYLILGRGGGGAPSAQPSTETDQDAPDDIAGALVPGARKRLEGRYTDTEMVALGFNRPFVHVDTQAKTIAQATFLANKKAAEQNRANRSLSYTVPGHTWPAIGGGKRVVWAMDTLVEVIDHRLGIEGVLYVESVTFRRGGDGTYTDLNLMRPEDVVFGDPT